MTRVVSASSFSISPPEKSQEGKQQQKVVERTFGMANWRRKFCTPASSESVSLSRSNARRKKESKRRFYLRDASHDRFSRHSYLAPSSRSSPKFEFRWRDFWKNQNRARSLFRASTRSVSCACARVQKNEKETRDVELLVFVFLLVSDGFEALLRAQSKLRVRL